MTWRFVKIALNAEEKKNKFISTYFFYSTISFSSLKDVTKARTKLLKEKSVLEVLFHSKTS